MKPFHFTSLAEERFILEICDQLVCIAGSAQASLVSSSLQVLAVSIVDVNITPASKASTPESWSHATFMHLLGGLLAGIEECCRQHLTALEARSFHAFGFSCLCLLFPDFGHSDVLGHRILGRVAVLVRLSRARKTVPKQLQQAGRPRRTPYTEQVR